MYSQNDTENHRVKECLSQWAVWLQVLILLLSQGVFKRPPSSPWDPTLRSKVCEEGPVNHKLLRKRNLLRGASLQKSVPSLFQGRQESDTSPSQLWSSRALGPYQTRYGWRPRACISNLPHIFCLAAQGTGHSALLQKQKPRSKLNRTNPFPSKKSSSQVPSPPSKTQNRHKPWTSST